MAIKIKKATEHTNRPYLFKPYDKLWPEKFQVEAARIRDLFGTNLVSIEHVGSTSIPGMWAKPQIDILVTVKRLEEVTKLYNAMASLGYVARGDWAGEGEEYFTYDNAEGVREVSVHVFPDGHRFAVDLLDVRDYLRTHPEDMEYYSRTKREANHKYPTDYTSYYKGKLGAIHEIRRRAAVWRGH